LGTAPKQKGKRTAVWWEAFNEDGAAPGFAHCILTKDGKLCNEKVKIEAGPTGLRNHIMFVHNDDYVRLCAKEGNDKVGGGADQTADNSQQKIPMLSERARDLLHRKCALWLVKKKRPMNVVEDEEFRDWVKDISHGAYIPPCRTTVRAHILKLSAEGQARLKDVNTSLRARATQSARRPAATTASRVLALIASPVCLSLPNGSAASTSSLMLQSSAT